MWERHQHSIKVTRDNRLALELLRGSAVRLSHGEETAFCPSEPPSPVLMHGMPSSLQPEACAQLGQEKKFGNSRYWTAAGTTAWQGHHTLKLTCGICSRDASTHMDLQHGGAHSGVLWKTDIVEGLAEDRTIVVLIDEADLHACEANMLWDALIRKELQGENQILEL